MTKRPGATSDNGFKLKKKLIEIKYKRENRSCGHRGMNTRVEF